MENIFGSTAQECAQIMKALGEPAYRGKQLFEWLYSKKATDFAEMTNLSKSLREKLAENFVLGHGTIVKCQEDPVDHTRKYLIALADGSCIETVLMSYHHGHSLCVSSQVGCSMGCAFCASTRGGKVRDLSAGEILDQIFLVEQDAGVRVANVVIMGIGEPLDNFDNVVKFIGLANEGLGIGQRKITLSTCGLVPQIEALADLDLQINLAISLHAPFQDRREILMPIAKKYSLNALIKVCNNYFTKTKRRITFEYALIDGFNDRPEDINELTALFKGVPCHINLIGLNPVTESVYKGSQNVNFFSDELKKRGLTCTIRRKIGDNIDAACGQLRLKHKENEER
ncbi:MAG: 23S rRNA (adenine(2503)-C(2))-methyltransferase RlmN [Eubacterium sp.]|nr:23S rRNA (adenine(2503)-C(2))-methyltransferase RlmN [Eubacterium sp.]